MYTSVGEWDRRVWSSGGFHFAGGFWMPRKGSIGKTCKVKLLILAAGDAAEWLCGNAISRRLERSGATSMEKLQTYQNLLKTEGLLKDACLRGRASEPVLQLSYRSGSVGKGTLFICKGAGFRRKYLEEAVSRAVVNLDSACGKRVLEAAGAARRVVTFGTSPDADICCRDVRLRDGKIRFSVSCDRFEQDFELAMRGVFNVENALAAIAAAYVEGIPPEDMREGLRRIKVEGRMEEYSVRSGKLCAIVDYAHNGLSFQRMFDAVRLEYPGYDLVAVFGCPGGKALNRRRDLGLLAGKNCKKIYLSTDDPGPERNRDIMRKIGYYVEKTGCPYECIPDREAAIRKALTDAEDYTVVLILGKGSERTQKIGRFQEICRPDSEIVRECLNDCGR